MDSVRSFSVFPDVSKYRDPLHLLLEYIAEVSTIGLVSVFPAHNINVNMQQASDCDMVLAHDDDLMTINGIGHGTVSEI